MYNRIMHMENRSDAQLITDYFEGKREALEVLISRYLKPVYGFIFNFVKDAGVAEDLTQEVFIKAWRRLKKFDRKKSFKPWIFKIARNAAIDFLRKKKAIPFSKFDNEDGENIILETIEDSVPLPGEIFDRENLARELEEAIEKLPHKQRAALYLHYQNYLTFEEIAEASGESVNTVKSRHRRAILELRKLLFL